jgi:deazaflavin-dependent oxidoreductase (nitroreductase family)
LKSDNVFPALKKSNEIELTVTGRKSGKPLPRPVWFVLRGTELLLLPVTGTDSQWYRNVLVNPQVKISASQLTFNGNLRVITEKRRIEEVIELFRGKYGPSDVKKYYPKPNVAASLLIS